MIAIIDYGLGNLFSLQSSLNHLSYDSVITRDKELIHRADKIILPGVGAFGDAMAKLEQLDMPSFLKKEASAGKVILGICLGMQLLFEKSYEFGEHQGLALIKGSVEALKAKDNLKIPHMGWNSLNFHKNHILLNGVKQGEFVYYVHSYYANNCTEALVASSDYGVEVAGIVANKNVMGTQFHPEKSGDTGLKILKNFCNCTREELQ